MHADDLGWTFSHRRQPGDGNRTGIACENSLRRAFGVQIAEQLFFGGNMVMA
jgi:hypothetical protein